MALCLGVRRNRWLKPHIANVVGPYGIARRCHSQWLVFALIPLEAQALTQAYRERFIETSSGSCRVVVLFWGFGFALVWNIVCRVVGAGFCFGYALVWTIVCRGVVLVFALTLCWY